MSAASDDDDESNRIYSNIETKIKDNVIFNEIHNGYTIKQNHMLFTLMLFTSKVYLAVIRLIYFACYCSVIEVV